MWSLFYICLYSFHSCSLGCRPPAGGGGGDGEQRSGGAAGPGPPELSCQPRPAHPHAGRDRSQGELTYLFRVILGPPPPPPVFYRVIFLYSACHCSISIFSLCILLHISEVPIKSSRWKERKNNFFVGGGVTYEVQSIPQEGADRIDTESNKFCNVVPNFSELKSKKITLFLHTV